MEDAKKDAEAIWTQMKNADEELRQKREWLMNFPEAAESSGKRLKLNEEPMLPESILRDDDLFCDTVKKHVKKDLGVLCHEATRKPATTWGAEPYKVRETILGSLDNLTNNGLYLLAKVVAGSKGTVFEKTRWSMKKFIKQNLPAKQCYSATVYAELSHIIRDRHNFLKNRAIRVSTMNAGLTIRPTVQSHTDATKIILDRLMEMSLQTLSAIHRRLTGVKASLPVLNPTRSGWTKARLAKRIQSLSLTMLSKLDSLDELPEPLVKAMEVACLSMKLNSNEGGSVEPNFCSNNSPEMESLQNEIIKAIELVDKVGLQEIKEFKELLAPGCEYVVVNDGLRKAIKRMLTEFLFECNDLDEIPVELVNTIDAISECALGRGKDVDEMVEGILNVSAQLKQVLWDTLPDCELDLEYSNAYMEDCVDSDDDFVYEEEEESDDTSVGSTADSHVKHCQVESAKPVEEEDCAEKIDDGVCRNKYVGLQEVCDEASLMAYRLIGRVLEGFARKDGESSTGDGKQATSSKSNEDDASIMIQAVEELIPSFSHSEMEKLRKILDDE